MCGSVVTMRWKSALADRLHVLLGEHLEEPFFAQPADVVARRLLAVAEDAEIQPRRLENQGHQPRDPHRRGMKCRVIAEEPERLDRLPSGRLSTARAGPWPNRTASSATCSANCRSAAATAASLAACCRVGPVRPVSAAFRRSARRARCGPGICPRRRGRWRSPRWPPARPCRRRIPAHYRDGSLPLDGRPWTVARPLLKHEFLEIVDDLPRR